MSKGLEALERIQCNYVHVFKARENGKAQLVHDLNTIEKELKRLEELDNCAYVSIHINRYNELCDKEEALKIIIEKQVNASALLVLDDFAEYNEYCSVVGGCKKLTLEEYDSVRKVLL